MPSKPPNKWEISYPAYCFSQSSVIAQYHRHKRQEGKGVQSRPPSVCVWYETLHTKIMIFGSLSLPPVVFSKTLPVAVVLCSPRVHCRKCSFTKEWPKVRHLWGNKGILYIYIKDLCKYMNLFWIIFGVYPTRLSCPPLLKLPYFLPGFNFCNHSPNNNDCLRHLLKVTNVNFTHEKNIWSSTSVDSHH